MRPKRGRIEMPTEHFHVPIIMWQPTFGEGQCNGCPERGGCYIATSPFCNQSNGTCEVVHGMLKGGNLTCDQLIVANQKKYLHDYVDLNPKVLHFATRERLRDSDENLELVRKLDYLCMPYETLAGEGRVKIEKWRHSGCKMVVNMIAPVSEEQYSSEFAPGVINLNQWAVDILHLILRKPALGCDYRVSTLQYYQKAIDLLKTVDQGNVQVVLDYCWSCMLRGAVCGAGIDRIHIWPNSAVTGCPYDSTGVTWGSAKPEFGSFKSNLRIVLNNREVHSSHFCKLREGMVNAGIKLIT